MTAARHLLGVSPAGSRAAKAQPPRQGGRRRMGGGAGEVLVVIGVAWEWLESLGREWSRINTIANVS